MTIESTGLALTFNERVMVAIRRMGGRESAARYLGVHPLTVTRWTKGYVVPPVATVRAIAAATEIDYEWLKPAPDDPEPASVVHPLGLEPRTH